MPSFKNLYTTDLHLHILGAYTTKAFFDLGKDVYKDVNWNEGGFVDYYNGLYETSLDPVGIFDRAINCRTGLEELRKAYVYSRVDGGDFARWEAKNSFFLRLWGHLRGQGRELDLLNNMLNRHKDEGYQYVEYRCGGQTSWHFLCAHALSAASDKYFEAKYIVSIPRDDACEAYKQTRELLDRYPYLANIIVGIDFASVEEGHPPKHVAPLFRQLEADNRAHPDRALDAVYHVGEQFFDKSIESAIRWCHEVAEMGAKRLGHAIALGLDPRVALSRRPRAHEYETVAERLDQISYDIEREEQLIEHNVAVNIKRLNSERQALQKLDPATIVRSQYDEARISNIYGRQEYVLQELTRLGTVIECCPTSNLRIGGIPDSQAHPIHRFLRSDVNLVVGTDDPGGFEITLEDEVRWVVKNTGLSEGALLDRLGDPRTYRLGQRCEATNHSMQS